MLVVIPRGLPRTGLAVARLVVVAMLVMPRQAAEPPADFDFGYVGYEGTIEPWPGPSTPYQFVLHRGGRELHVIYTGPDPKLAYGDEIAVFGHMIGGELVATKIEVGCDWRSRSCLMRHPEQLHGRELPADEPPYYK